MAQRVIVQVSGFSAAERHALNTAFRLSEERETAYSPWTLGAPVGPQLLLLDGESAAAAAELQLARSQVLDFIWFGPAAPPQSWRVFRRPIPWHEVFEAMDERFAPKPAKDLQRGSDPGVADTQPPDTQPPEPEQPEPRGLIVSADREQRLYLRARMALAGLTSADEAESGVQALEMARSHPYSVAMLEHGLPQVDGWALLKQLRGARADAPLVILSKDGCIIGDRLLAWMRGAAAFVCKRPDPGTLEAVLDKVIAASRKQADGMLATQQ